MDTSRAEHLSAVALYQESLRGMERDLERKRLDAAVIHTKELRKWFCYALSLNEDAVTHQPIMVNGKQQFVVEMYDDNAEKQWDWNGPNGSPSPPNIDTALWDAIICQYLQIGRTWLTAIPLINERRYQWLCITRTEGELVDGSAVSCNANIKPERVLKGMGYLQCRHLGVLNRTPSPAEISPTTRLPLACGISDPGVPLIPPPAQPHNLPPNPATAHPSQWTSNYDMDVHRALLEYLERDYGWKVERILPAIIEGYSTPGLDTTCLVTKAKFPWAGNYETEVKIFPLPTYKC